jgi:hypothetical protein
MTPDEWSDRIYDATGLVVTREQALAIGQMIRDAYEEALDKAALVPLACPLNDDDGLTYFEAMNRDQEMMLEILALKKAPLA